MGQIPRGFAPGTGSQRARRALSALAPVRMARAKTTATSERAAGIEKLGATLTGVAAQIQEQQIRLDEKAQRELESVERDKRTALASRATATAIESTSQRTAAALLEDREIDDDDWGQVDDDIITALGEGDYAFLREDPEFSGRMDLQRARAKGQAVVQNARLNRVQAQEDNDEAVWGLVETAATHEELDAVLPMLELESYTPDQRRTRRKAYNAAKTRLSVAGHMDRLNAVLDNPELDADEALLKSSDVIASVSGSANVSDDVKKQFGSEASVAQSRFDRQSRIEAAYGAEELKASQQAARIGLDDEARLGELTHQEIDVALDQSAMYNLTPSDARRLHTAVDKFEDDLKDFTRDSAWVNTSMSTGYTDTSRDAQNAVDNVFDNGTGAEAYAKWAELAPMEKMATLSVAQTGSIPSTIRTDLSAAQSSNNPTQIARAFEAYSLLEYSPATEKTAYTQLPEDTRRYWDAIQNIAATGTDLTEAKRVIDERLALPRDVIGVLQPQYKDATKDGRNLKALEDAIEDSDSPYLDGGAVNARTQGLYEGLVRENYFASNGGDLEAAQKTAFKSFQRIISTSYVNGYAEVMTPAPEHEYGITTGQVMDAVIADSKPFLDTSLFAEGKTPELRLNSDPLSLRKGGWQVMWRESPDDMWHPAVNKDQVPMRWSYTPPPVVEQQETLDAHHENLRKWEAEFERLPREDAPGSRESQRRAYIQLKQAQETEAAGEQRSLYFRGDES